MNKLDEIKQIYREYVKQFEYLTERIYSLPACRQFTEVSSFYRRIEKKTDLLKNMAERGLDQIHAITPPTVERVTRYKNMLKFLNAFYVLWCESFIIQYDGYLCVPPYTADPHENYPFFLHSVEVVEDYFSIALCNYLALQCTEVMSLTRVNLDGRVVCLEPRGERLCA